MKEFICVICGILIGCLVGLCIGSADTVSTTKYKSTVSAYSDYCSALEQIIEKNNIEIDSSTEILKQNTEKRYE